MAIFLEIDDALDEDQKVWRYMDLAKFVSMLEQKALWLARADTFRDRHEGRLPSEMRKFIEKAYEGFKVTDGSRVKDADDFQDYLLKNTFISCWHGNLDENMVMWEIYGKNSSAVAVQTTIREMKRSIDTSAMMGHSLLLKKVIYEKADDVSGVLAYEECFFRKRPHFSFEKEVRISLDTYTPSNPSKSGPCGHRLPVNVNEFIASIVVHPDSKQWFVDVVNSVATKYGIHAPIERGAYGNE